jgi:hypothetical protein
MVADTTATDQDGPIMTDNGIDISDDPYADIEEMRAERDVYYEDDDQLVLRLPRDSGYPGDIVEFADAMDMDAGELERAVGEAATESPKHGWYLTIAK